MDSDKEKQEISIIGRLFSLEALLILMGLLSLISGIAGEEPMPIFWGVMILGGSVALHFVRKKDWKKHWEELEQEKRFHEERIRAKKEQEKAKEKGDGRK